MAKPKGSPKTGGRQPGTPNKATADFRQTITDLLGKNAQNVDRWLQMVAEGDGAEVKPDPAKALDLLAKLAEYGAPKLNRTELTGKEGKDLTFTLSRDDAAL